MRTTLKTAVVPLLTQITDCEKPERMSIRGQAGESECESGSEEEEESECESEEEGEGERGRSSFAKASEDKGRGDGENGLSGLSGDELSAAFMLPAEKIIRKSIKKDIEMKCKYLISFSLSTPMKDVLFIPFYPPRLPALMAGFKKTTID